MNYSHLVRTFVFMNLMDAFHDHDQVYLEIIESDGYSSLPDEDKKYIVKRLRSGMDIWNFDPIGIAMLLDFIKRYDTDDNMGDIEL